MDTRDILALVSVVSGTALAKCILAGDDVYPQHYYKEPQNMCIITINGT